MKIEQAAFIAKLRHFFTYNPESSIGEALKRTKVLKPHTKMRVTKDKYDPVVRERDEEILKRMGHV